VLLADLSVAHVSVCVMVPVSSLREQTGGLPANFSAVRGFVYVTVLVPAS